MSSLVAVTAAANERGAIVAPLVFTFNKVVVETLTLALDRPDQIGLSVQSYLPMFAIGTTIPRFTPGEPITFAMTLRNSLEDVLESQFMSFDLNFDNGIESCGIPAIEIHVP